MAEKYILINKNKSRKADFSNLSDEVKKSFLNQFAENQNHHQRLFIQFLSSMLFVLAAYAFVFSNTKSYNSINTLNAKDSLLIRNKENQISLYKSTSDSITVKPFDSVKNNTGNILSYGVIHLLSIYIFAQIVLCVLSIILLHLGYSFRRDQVIVNKIRKNGLGFKEYDSLFGGLYSGIGKNIINYLPNFYSILYLAIFSTQAIICASLYIYINEFPKDKVFIENFLNNTIYYQKLKFYLALPSLISSFFYLYYFDKYNKKVNNASILKTLSIVRVTNRKILKTIAIASFALAILKFFFFYYTSAVSVLTSGLIDIANAVSCSFSFYLLIKQKKPSTSLNPNSNLAFRNLLHAVSFFICFLLIALLTYYYFNPKSHIIMYPWQIVYTFSLLILALSVMNFKRINLYPHKHQNTVYKKLIEYEIYILGLLVITFFLIAITKIKFLDILLSIFLGLFVLLISISRFSTFLNIHLERRNDGSNSPYTDIII